MALNNAHNFAIGSATFNSIFPPPQSLLGGTGPSEILRLARAVEATHTSNTASYAPKCNPETRLKVIGDIADWAIEGTGANESTCTTSPHTSSILWFSGPAGGGKTCIMRNVVDRCEAAGLSALSYFFSTRGSGLSTERPFVATIVDQLATLHPHLRHRILTTILDRPGIFEGSLDIQMNKLVVETLESQGLQSQSPMPGPRRIVIVIDGFDECGSEREREHLLTLLLSVVQRLSHLIVIVLASRPELDIRTAFEDAKTLKNITKLLRLQDYDGTEDIRIFLCDEFERIRTTHPLRNSIPANWPAEEIIQILLDKSSGNFIYPATLIKYIKNPRRNPVDLLDEVVNLSNAPSSGTSNALAELDALYAVILHPPETDLILMKRILHCLLGITVTIGPDRRPFFRSPSFLDQFPGLPPNTTRTILCDLHSILSVPESEEELIELHHRSLEDYLLSPDRSLEMYQSPYETYLDLTMVCIDHLQRWAKNPTVDDSKTLYYSSLYWDDTLGLCIENKPASATLPSTVVDLDPRFILPYLYVHAIGDNYYSLCVVLRETTLCPELQGSQLVQRVSHMSNCAIQMLKGSRTHVAKTTRLNAIAEFEAEIGLYNTPPDFHITHDNVESDVAAGVGSGTAPQSQSPSLDAAGPSSLPARAALSPTGPVSRGGLVAPVLGRVRVRMMMEV